MDLDVLSRLIHEAQRVETHFKGLRWYAFGSWAQGDSAFNDVDVLVVYSDGVDSRSLWREIEPLLCSMPLDLYLFHEEEEREFAFVARQGCCRRIFPGAIDRSIE